MSLVQGTHQETVGRTGARDLLAWPEFNQPPSGWWR
jgi:hypothetical protein